MPVYAKYVRKFACGKKNNSGLGNVTLFIPKSNLKI